MGQHSRTKKYIDLAHSRCVYRHGAESDWRCMGCGKTYSAASLEDIAGLAYVGELPPDYIPHIDVVQDNGVTLHVCLLCAALACGKDGDTFRMLYPGEFEPHKIQGRARKRAFAFFSEWRDNRMGYLQAFSEILPDMVGYREESDSFFKEVKGK